MIDTATVIRRPKLIAKWARIGQGRSFALAGRMCGDDHGASGEPAGQARITEEEANLA